MAIIMGPQESCVRSLGLGKGYYTEIDIQGALKIKSIYPQAVFVFIIPPSLQELEKRITDRERLRGSHPAPVELCGG